LTKEETIPTDHAAETVVVAAPLEQVLATIRDVARQHVWVKEILEAEVLLLDDLGAGRTTAWAQDVMHDVLAHRYNRKLPTVMTTNRATGDDDDDATTGSDAPTLRDRLGDALMSRIYEMCRVIPVNGEDYRRRILHARHRF